MEFEVDETIVNEVEELINSDEFIQFLLSHTTQLGSSALILDAVFRKLDEVKMQLGEINE